MLVTNKLLLDAAREGGYAVGAFNINNMEFLKGIVETADEEDSPVIIAVSEGAIEYAGFGFIVDLVKRAAEEVKVQISLHLDHGRTMELIELCIKGGFTSVMIDGSHLPFEENIDITKKVVGMARPAGVSVEGELGRLSGIEDNISVEEREAILTDPDEAVEFVDKTGLDALAIAVGTSHGAYKFKGETNLAYDRISKISSLVDIPLVLHGASGVNQNHVEIANKFGAELKGARGVSDEAIGKAIECGISKINIDTDMRIAFMAFVRKHLYENRDNIDPRKYLGAGKEGIAEVVRTKMDLFGSKCKAV